MRLHMTHFDRERDIPSGFCLKLRKHIRTRRLEAVRQLGDGGDRIIDLVFSGEGAVCAHLIIEAFSGGNVILTDANYVILTLLRAYRLNDSPDAPTRVAVRERYPIENARAYSNLNHLDFMAAADRALKAVSDVRPVNPKLSNRAANRKQYARGVARKSLAMELAIEPCLVEHAIITAGFAPDVRLEQLFENDKQGLDSIFKAFSELDVTLKEQMALGQMKGYIVFKTVDGPKGKVERYDEFSPYLFAQYKDRPIKEFKSFDAAADEFFARLESDRIEASQAKREAATYKKVDKLENELRGKVTAFEVARDKSSEMAQAIESNVTEVDAVITVINSAIAAAVPWDGLARMVDDEKKNGNPVAEIIHSLQLEKNEITLMLEDTFGFDDEDEDDEGGVDDNDDDDDDDSNDDDNDDDDGYNDGNVLNNEDKKKEKRKRGNIFKPSPESRAAFLVSVDLNLTAHANARRFYDMRKSAAAKMETAQQVKNRTVKAASKRAESEAQRLEEEAVAASIRARRTPFWFEKFYWFVSSENYLVVAGRDLQQNELLVKRYLGPADVYVHADLDGAASVIVKNRRPKGATKHSEIPRMSLEQAGIFAMSRSAAWEAKIVSSAWWVRAVQVSKTTSTGVYLPTGGFAIRGRKNYLDPAQLVMGFAFLFRLDDASATRHRGERGLRGVEELEESELPQSNTQELGQDSADSKEEDLVPNTQAFNLDEPVVPNLKSAQKETSEEITGASVDNVPTTEDNTSAEIGGIGASIEKDKESLREERNATGSNEVVPSTGSEASSTKSVPRSKKKHLSARERKALKNGKGGNTRPEAEGVTSKNAADSEQEKVGPSSKGSVPLPRGKKHKLKKMKKYMDQDEDERRMALAVLGAKPIKEDPLDAESNVNGENKEDDANDGKDNNGDDNENEEERKRNGPREPKQEEMRLLDEEGIIELSRLEQDTVNALDLLTAVPNPDDVVEFAMPVCGPYSALSQYRYRVKMMPGSMKRGKAYRAATVLFQKQAEKDLSQCKQERDAIRISPESEGIHGMIGNVKIMAPGLANAQKAIAKAKKGSSSSKKGKQK